MRIIPAVDIKEGRCVRLSQGKADQETVYSNDPVSMANHWDEEGAQTIHVVDLDGAFQGLPVNSEIVNRKSTRLNASHTSNSYAVSRLKKKNPDRAGRRKSAFRACPSHRSRSQRRPGRAARSEEHTSELPSRRNLVCLLSLAKNTCSHAFLLLCEQYCAYICW